MPTREVLEAAIDQVMTWVRGDDRRPTPNQILAVGTLLIAARERLAQLPKKCGNDWPGYEPETIGVKLMVHPIACACTGAGKVYPAETVEKIAKAIGINEHRAVAVLDALGETE